MATTVDLLMCELREYDATSTHSLLLRDLLVDMGSDVRIVVEHKTDHPQRVTLLDSWKADADLVILQHAIGSEIAQRVIARQVPVVVNYHNITPPELVEVWQPELVAGLVRGRAQLHQMAPITRLGIADSRFNAREMLSAGMREVVVVPVLRDFSVMNPHYGARPLDVIPDDGGTVLFVGRLAPNKCCHDLISATRVLTRSRPKARLVLVGNTTSEDYRRQLEALAERLGISEQVAFVGGVSDEELFDWYCNADVFACVSEHEGFCVPLVEAMACRLPVVAYDAAAVPNTVRGAGIVLSSKHPTTVATAIDRVLSDQRLRQMLTDRGVGRASQLHIDITQQRMRRALAKLGLHR